ncbi:zinc-binding alcohol dehydrogenase [Actinoplanes sp. TFC3]|uniref:zinc-dependent alcohol dehydrogenase n=1 Tax=Actinoplanes sp. TFC3 TaxID=1710355 RepID=UPI0008297582|nr:zinc-binding alcohol dehydrogenase [Actinoplanes sp. TFC3]
MADRNLIVSAPGRLEIVDEEVAPGPFRVRTLFSGVSAGTELSFVKNTNPALHHGFDPELALFGGPGDDAYPVTRLGYMEVGIVTHSSTAAAPTGTTVAMTYGHRTGWTGDPLRDRIVVLPADLDPMLGIYAAHMGPICANGLLHAAADRHGPGISNLGDGVRGLRVAVTGAGVVGLLTALFARAHGAASVVVLDPSPQRRAVAEALGLETLDTSGSDPAVTLKTRWRHWPGDRGADVVFQCRGQASALQLALRLLRPQGTVVDLAFYQGGADELRLGEEFHHNGLRLICAQIGRVPRGLAGIWDRERLSTATVELLRHDGELIRQHLITAVVPFEEGPALLHDLAARRRQEVQSILSFDHV